MSKQDKTTQIVSDGLRYRSKQPGSPFSGAGSFSQGTMSCFYCGKHRLRSMMETRKFIGKSQVICSPSCKAVDELLAETSKA